MMLGALFGLMASPAVRLPLVTIFVVIGIPLLTFAVAAPSRIGLARELGLLLRGLEAAALSLLLSVVGRFDDARAVHLRQRVRVENAYASGTGPLAQIVASDPLRLHHLRRLGLLGAVLAVVAGNALPLVFPQTYTWGDDAGALGVLALDVVTIGLASRLVSERMAIRLLETTHALGGGSIWSARARVVPLSAMLGTAMGAVGALVVLATAAAASAVETSWLFETDMVAAGLWFIRETAPLALPLGVGIGGVMGAAAGLAQPPQR
ncbi:MAG: hypothetical protein A2138_14430 [Deltaproteobacteria bacterium RBG_16_71_12]|nr:MAG: hypothetical protein A2138_14430 [Deltaproteobacteria bacterium RBG_16_71_12]